jgi:hypothetical protein
MAQYSFYLPFSLHPHAGQLAWNRDLIEWYCEKCGVQIADKDVAIEHVRVEHGNGTIWPKYSRKGQEPKLVCNALQINVGYDKL